MEQLATTFATYLAKQLELDDEQREILKFGALTALLHLSSVLTVIAIATVTRSLAHALAVTAAIMVIRHASGGPHVETPLRCYITSSATLLILTFAGAHLGLAFATGSFPLRLIWVLGVSGVGLMVLAKYAPVAAPRRPLSPQHRERMRRLSLMLGSFLAGLLMVGAIIGSPFTASAALGFLFQVLTLTPAGITAVNLIDGWFTAERRK